MTPITRLRSLWIRFWLLFLGRRYIGRMATRLACLAAPPFAIRHYAGRRPFIAPSATIHHDNLSLGTGVYVDDRVLILRGDPEGGPVRLADKVAILRECIIQTGSRGNVTIDEGTWIQARCHLVAYLNEIRIGKGVQIAPGCAFFSYDHGVEPGLLISEQPITSKGPIIIDDDAWLGYGAVVLSGVRIGKGAVIGANAVVTRSVPDGAIAVGNPARILRNRAELKVAQS